MVRAKDTPNFVANRIGVFSMLATIANAEKYGIRFDVVDDLTGPRLGRPKSATFRTADVGAWIPCPRGQNHAGHPAQRPVARPVQNPVLAGRAD